jgi:lipoprotein-releasing system permease protein
VARLALSWLFHRPVQLLAVLGVAIGLLALLVVLAVMNGLIEMNRAGVQALSADLHLIPAATEAPAKFAPYGVALQIDEIEAVSPHLVAYALLSVPGASANLSRTQNADFAQLQVVGIDPEAERLVTDFGAALSKAAVAPVPDPAQPFLLPDETFARPGVLVSDALARGIPRRRGETLRGVRIELGALPWKLPPAGQELRPVNGMFTVAGSYLASDYRVALDRVYMQRTGENGLRSNLLGTKAPDFTEILIRLKPGVDPEAAKAPILAALSRAGLPLPGGAQGGELVTWQERNVSFLSAIENERQMIKLVLFFIVIVASFGLFAVLSALVREKVRDLGVLAALGCTPAQRGSLVFGIGCIAAGVGAGLGLGGAWLLVRHKDAVAEFLRTRLGIEIFAPDLYVVDGLPAVWDASAAGMLTLGAFGVGLLFAAAPTLRAAFLDPVEALRYE